MQTKQQANLPNESEDISSETAPGNVAVALSLRRNKTKRSGVGGNMFIILS
jgi:hypothetical protein